MEQSEKDTGTKEDLCLYHIQTAEENLKAAVIYHCISHPSGMRAKPCCKHGWLVNIWNCQCNIKCEIFNFQTPIKLPFTEGLLN